MPAEWPHSSVRFSGLLCSRRSGSMALGSQTLVVCALQLVQLVVEAAQAR